MDTGLGAMDVWSSVRRRVDTEPAMAVLALGDLIAIAAFVVPGGLHHGYTLPANLPQLLDTYGQFLIGWFVVSLVGSLYTRDAISNTRRAISWTVPAWVVTVLIAQVLRSTPLFHGSAAVTFALVSVVVGGALLLVWRVVATAVFGGGNSDSIE